MSYFVVSFYLGYNVVFLLMTLRLPSAHSTNTTLSLHDALPIWAGDRRHPHEGQLPQGRGRNRGRLRLSLRAHRAAVFPGAWRPERGAGPQDRKSTRLNSSH